MRDLHKEPRTAVHLYLSSFDHSQMHCHFSGTAEKRSNREIKQSFGLDCVSLSSLYRIPLFLYRWRDVIGRYGGGGYEGLGGCESWFDV